jgi:SAM-dependent methyltransferase
MSKTVCSLYAEHQGYVSDKWASYLSVYDRWFSKYQDAPIRLLEVGVQNGGSLQVWAKYFANAKKIVGCDINPDCIQLEFDDPRIALVLGDVKDANVREKILKHSDVYDIIIDDGSHINADIIKTFQYFYSHLAPGGIYVLEDLHCSYWGKWHGGLWRADSAMEFFKSLTDVLNLESWGVKLLPANWVKKLKSSSHSRFKPADYADIESISFYNSMCVIVKGHELNSIGGRVVAGDIALVYKNLPKPNSKITVPFQKKNCRKLKLKK